MIHIGRCLGKYIVRLAAVAAVMGGMQLLSPAAVYAAELPAAITLPDGEDSACLSDGAYETCVSMNGGDTITVKSNDGSRIYGLYLIWNSPVSEWTLETDTGSIVCGEYGFLHEWIPIEEGTSEAVINITGGSAKLSGIRIFDTSEPADDVQVWLPPTDEADIMLVSAHADDEILFLGGIIPTYAVAGNARVQVVYMSQFWDSAPVREHEKLDGLWASGLRYYPVSAGFGDFYSTSLEAAKSMYDEDKMVQFVVEQLRRFRPQVVVTHDFNGEYGHGYHMLTAEAVSLALEAAADENMYQDSALEYDVWDVPKAYFHLYQDNAIELNLRVPIEQMDGLTALEVAQAAYKMHVSQQWCWFYVSDDYQYSCARFGLYRTKVGQDTENDMLENIRTYYEQEWESAEEESRIQESIEQESIKQESIRKSEEAESESVSQSIAESAAASEEESRLSKLAESEKLERERDAAAAAAIVVIVLCTALLVVCKAKKRKKGVQK